MSKRLKLKDILIPGASIKAVKLDPNDPEVKRLIEQTVKQQEEILAMKDAPGENLRITI